MIYLHKLLPLLLSPIVLVMALVLYGAIRKRRIPALAALTILYLLSTPLVSGTLFRAIEGHRVRLAPEDAPVAEAIVVLSGMLMSVPTAHGRTTEWSDADRYFGGLELYKARRAKRIIFTGGLSPWDDKALPEGVFLKSAAMASGIPEKDILVSGPALNTEDEAREVRKLLDGERPDILLVTSAFHMPRAKATFEKAGFAVREYPVDFKVAARDLSLDDFLPYPGALSLSDTAIRETIGRMYYAVKALLTAAAANSR